jgi:hypothetical protein
MPDLLRRAFAAGGVVLVLALGFLSAAPQAHAWLHATPVAHGPDCSHSADHAGTTEAEAGCVVELFAQGISGLPAALLVPVPDGGWWEPAPVCRGELRLAAPRHLHPPERGPPALN